MKNTSPVQVEINVQDLFFGELVTDDAIATAASSTDIETNPSGTESSITVHPDSTQQSPISDATWNQWFCCWLEQLSADRPDASAYELSLRLTHDEDIKQLNAQYRHKDQPTDVLAFAALEADYPIPEELQAEMPLYLGDIVISVETAERQAQQQEHSLEQELAWLAAHALLHLLGWDHPDDESLACMLSQQEALLQTVGLSTHYYQEDKR